MAIKVFRSDVLQKYTESEIEINGDGHVVIKDLELSVKVLTLAQEGLPICLTISTPPGVSATTSDESGSVKPASGTMPGRIPDLGC